MRLERGRRIQIGRLGRFHFAAGSYVYVGTAWGPGGLTARVGRHLRKDKNCRWHIDYLRRHATITQVWSGRCRPDEEHLWIGIFGSLAGAVVPVEKFGSSDCRCPAHLLRLPEAPAIEAFNRALLQQGPGRQKALLWNGIEDSVDSEKCPHPGRTARQRSPEFQRICWANNHILRG